jgi:hypothetical protein
MMDRMATPPSERDHRPKKIVHLVHAQGGYRGTTTLCAVEIPLGSIQTVLPWGHPNACGACVAHAKAEATGKTIRVAGHTRLPAP